MSVLRHSATVRGLAECRPSRQPTENHAAALRRTLPSLSRLRGNLDAVWLLRARLPDDAAADGEAKPRPTSRARSFSSAWASPSCPSWLGPHPSSAASVTPAPSFLGWALLQCLRVRARSEAPSRPAGRSARRYRSASPPCQSTEPSRPRPETAMVNGCCKRARPAKVARRCGPLSLSRATAASRLSQQTTRQEKGSASADQATPS